MHSAPSTTHEPMSTQRITHWFTFQNFVVVASALIAVGSILNNVNSLDKRLSVVESRSESLNTAVLEMRGDVKVVVKVLEQMQQRQNQKDSEPSR